MPPKVPRFDKVVSWFRDTQPTKVVTLKEVDPNEFWKRFVWKAIGGGYFKSANEFVLFVEACMRYLSFEQVVQNRAYALVVRDLADTLARKWACVTAPIDAPTADEIAGLLLSEWVTSGEFTSLRSSTPYGDSVPKEVIYNF